MARSVFTAFHRAHRIALVRAFLCCLVFALSPVPAAEAAARIVYTADTAGYLHPCASCGGNATGGLARRAALLASLAAEGKNPLILAGPREFYADRNPAVPEDDPPRTRALHHAFSRMPYSGIAVSRAAQEAFGRLGLGPLTGQVVYDDEPVTAFYRAGTVTAACIFFPPGTEAGSRPSPAQADAAIAAAREAAKSAALIIGISPWGMHAENALMERFAPYFHIILGGGSGIAVPGQAVNPRGLPGPLWARANRMGRAVNVLDIHEIPAKNSPWLDGVHYTARLVPLDKNIPEDREVAKIVAAVPKD